MRNKNCISYKECKHDDCLRQETGLTNLPTVCCTITSNLQSLRKRKNKVLGQIKKCHCFWKVYILKLVECAQYRLMHKNICALQSLAHHFHKSMFEIYKIINYKTCRNYSLCSCVLKHILLYVDTEILHSIMQFLLKLQLLFSLVFLLGSSFISKTFNKRS